MRNPPRPEACTSTRQHSVIAAALAALTLLPLSPVLKALLAELLRCCVDADHPGKPFRVTVAHLMRTTSRSRSSVGRDLAALKLAGWICRIQDKTRARRDGFKPGTTWLTPEATALLFPLRASPAVHKTNHSSNGEPAPQDVDNYRVPKDLNPLAERVGAGRVVYLMRLAGHIGQRVQTHQTAALAADDAMGYVLDKLKPARRHSRHTAPRRRHTWQTHGPADTRSADTGAAGHVGESYRYATRVLEDPQTQRAACVMGEAARARVDAWRVARRQ